MSHAAAIYTVQVHRRGRPAALELLGHIGDEGGRLLWALEGYMAELDVQSEDGNKTLTAVSWATDEAAGELRVGLSVGIRGQRVDVFEEEALAFAQQPGHTARVRSAALFQLPADGNLGYLAVYVPHRRGAMTLLRQGLTVPFAADFPDYVLKVSPAISGTALEAALEQDLIEKVELVRFDRHTDAFAGGSSKWLRQGSAAQVALEIRSRGGRLLPNLIRRYLTGDESVWGEIVEFEGLRFDGAKVQVEQDGRHHTYNIERPESGHATTIDIEPELSFADGWPTEETVFPALRRAMSAVPGQT